jgi:uncharacterized repeat protein (TIGR03803 family)
VGTDRTAKTVTRLLLIFTMIATALMLTATLAEAQTEAVLYSFNNTQDLSEPVASLIVDHAGNFYSTAEGGGTNQWGGIFELSPPAVQGASWTESILYNFTGGIDGALPEAGLVMDANGALYGTTAYGGTGAGVIFQLSPPSKQGDAWTETVLYTFTNGSDGGGPTSTLIFDKIGNLYGTAHTAGASRGGVVFELTPPSTGSSTWTYNVIHNFTSQPKSAGGYAPYAGLVAGPRGFFYGTTTAGGANNGGVVFKLAPPTNGQGKWVETILHAFNGIGDGTIPQAGLVAGKGGILFGTTLGGGSSGLGTVYELIPPLTEGGSWTESVLHSFGTDASSPTSPVTLTSGGTLYGTVAKGGANYGGILFKLTPPLVSGDPWVETTLFSFPSYINPSGLSLVNGALYGTSEFGGTDDYGTVFELSF